MIPCPGCRTHWEEFWTPSRIKIALKDRANFVVSLFIFHNIVTDRTIKQRVADAEAAIHKISVSPGRQTAGNSASIVGKLRNSIAKLKGMKRYTFQEFEKEYYGKLLMTCDVKSVAYDKESCIGANRNSTTSSKIDYDQEADIKRSLQEQEMQLHPQANVERAEFRREKDDFFETVDKELYLQERENA